MHIVIIDVVLKQAWCRCGHIHPSSRSFMKTNALRYIIITCLLDLITPLFTELAEVGAFVQSLMLQSAVIRATISTTASRVKFLLQKRAIIRPVVIWIRWVEKVRIIVAATSLPTHQSPPVILCGPERLILLIHGDLSHLRWNRVVPLISLELILDIVVFALLRRWCSRFQSIWHGDFNICGQTHLGMFYLVMGRVFYHVYRCICCLICSLLRTPLIAGHGAVVQAILVDLHLLLVLAIDDHLNFSCL